MTLVEQLTAIAKHLKVQFTLNNKPVSYSEVFSEVGYLPAIAKRADQLCSLCLGYGIGATFEEDEKAKVGKRVRFDDATPNSVRLVCLFDVIYNLVKSAPSRDKTPIDELDYDK
jgi:intracellular multiplication protein IcmS